jgi:hypothetical protein
MTKFNPENEFFDPNIVIGETGMPPIGYYVETNLGSLNVTIAANEAYGLVPLQPTLEGGGFGNEPKADSVFPFINITLLSPEEFSEYTGRSMDDTHGRDMPVVVGIVSKAGNHKGHIDLRMCFTKTKAQVMQESAELVKDRLPYEPVGEDIPMGPNGENLFEILEQSIPQQYAHALAQSITEQMMQSLIEHDRATAATKFVEFTNRKGNLALLGSGLLLAMSSAFNGRVTLVGAAGATAYYAFGKRAIQQDIQAFAQNSLTGGGTPVGREQSGPAVMTLAEQVHKLFCSTHFNNQASTMFEDLEPPEEQG